MPNRYRKHPVEVEAVQWTGENREEVEAFTGDRDVRLRQGFAMTSRDALPGDWIVRPTGHSAPGGHVVPAEQFKATYEPAGQPPDYTCECCGKPLGGMLCVSCQTASDQPAQPVERGELEGDFTFEIFTDWQDQFRWRLLGRLGRVVATSDTSYRTEQIATRAIEALRVGLGASSQPVLDVEGLRKRLVDGLHDAMTDGQEDGEVIPFGLAEEAIDAALSDLEERDGRPAMALKPPTSSTPIPEEAVEAAGIAAMKKHHFRPYDETARTMLEAAAPHLLAVFTERLLGDETVEAAAAVFSGDHPPTEGKCVEVRREIEAALGAVEG